MEKQDARKLSRENLEMLRNQGIRLIRHGRTQAEISQILGVRAATVSGWLKKYRTGGKDALKVSAPGPAKGSLNYLNSEQEKAIQKLIISKNPDQLKLPFALWDRKAIRELIIQQYGIHLAIRTVGDYLQRWHFTPQRPLKRAYEQQPKQVKQWLNDIYPEIARRAKQENAEIHWGDETGLRSDNNYSRGYSPRGKTPVVNISAKRVSVNMISTVTNQGKVRFMMYKKGMNTEVLLQFLKRLIRVNNRKIFLILDNLRVHHAYKVRDWLAAHSLEIEVFYLPSYSPELNPDEYLNGDLKRSMQNQPLSRSESDLSNHVRSFMRGLQRTPDHVISYFNNHHIAYAS